MRSCASLGLLACEGGQFTTTAVGDLLREDVPGSLREAALVQGAHAHWHWQALGLLPEAVRAGHSQARAALGMDGRVVGTETVAVTSSAKVEMLTMNTLIPVPAAAGRYMLVTCCSPNLPLAEEVYELFDAITSTFHFIAPERQEKTL